MKLAVSPLALLVLLAPAWGASVQDGPGAAETAALSVGERLAELVEGALEGSAVPGAIVGIAHHGEPIQVAAHGLRKSKSQVAITAGDLVHIGSCTKAMTATLAARYVDRGLLRWDSTLEEVLPELASAVHEGFRAVTLLDCLTHTAGVPANCSSWFAHGKLPLVKRRLALAETNLADGPEREIGKEYEYSNLGYMLAGCFLERVGEGTWEELIAKDVFGPLGMTSAGFGPPNTKDEVDQPWGHVFLGGVALHRQSDNPEALGPAGRVHLTVEDWSRFALQFTEAAAAADTGDTPFLSADSRATLVEVRANRYACGWGVMGTGEAIRHSGSNTMWYATVHVRPEDGLAYFAVVNAAGGDASEVVGEMITGLSRIDRAARR
ncbi:MAG: serine hydrolase domain-containing protein [Planctomycetota bacterium]|nr:serine hydrolase domain-containing protein [Planctomycetota bacterium]MEC8512475.1 serine hydrolase domain-containing protein [Planctomycetota bacterium]